MTPFPSNRRGRDFELVEEVDKRDEGGETALPTKAIGRGAQRRRFRQTAPSTMLFVVHAEVEKHLVLRSRLVELRRGASSDAIGGSGGTRGV
jgi:hypothetical protein